MKIEIRQAEKEDMKYVLELIKELAIFEREPDAVVIKSEDLIQHGFGNKPLFSCFVAVTNNLISGMCLGYPRYSTWKGPTFHLEDLIVTESYKGQGFGTKLYSEFIKIAYELGVARIEWNVLDWNTPAIEFYEKSGASVIHEWSTVQMHKAEMEAYLKGLKK